MTMADYELLRVSRLYAQLRALGFPDLAIERIMSEVRLAPPGRQLRGAVWGNGSADYTTLIYREVQPGVYRPAGVVSLVRR